MKKLVILSLLLTVVFAIPAFSQMNDTPMKEHEGRHGQMMGMSNMDKMGDMMGMCIEHPDNIGLTNDQILKMKPLHSEMQKKNAQFKADLKIAEIELKEIMEVKDFDIEKADSAVRKNEALKTAHHLEMLKAMKEMRTILTDEQFTKMITMKTNEKTMKRMMKK